VDEWVEIRGLATKGVPIAQISRQTGRDRKTVRKVLREQEPKLKRQTGRPRGSKLDPFREYLLSRVEQGCLNGSLLLEEITRLGYQGKGTVLRDFLQPLRQERRRRQEATERFETGPGLQAQVDWAEFGRIWDETRGRWLRLYAFVFTLGYSRAMYLEFTTACDMEHFLGAHLGAFEALGIPEEILYDNLRTAILGRQGDGSPIFPGRFLDFALYCGFSPKFCRPYRARTKGKVERSVGYVRQNFWPRVSEAVKAGELGLGALNQWANEWVERVAQQRVHGTHGEVVAERYAEEATRLGRLDGRPLYDTSYRRLCWVGKDGRLAYRGRIYQVGAIYALSEVQAEESLEGEVRFRRKDGRVLRAQQVSPQPKRGKVHPVSQEVGAAAQGGELRLVCPQAPQVQTRGLEVYEEVARAGGAN
jgi:transposase